MNSQSPHPSFPSNVQAYLARLYGECEREFACRARTPEDVAAWQAEARPTLRRLLGLGRMERLLKGHRVTAQFDAAEDLGDCTRQRGRLETEPSVWIPFWLLRPKGEGPFPLALTPHGHDARGHDTSAGVAASPADLRRIAEEDRDVAVQAARHGYLALAPATRGIGCDGVPDLGRRHDGRSCRSQLIHCLIAGRTAMGERVWDMERFTDWALANLPVHDRDLLMLGNSGGGMVTTYAAACDTRVQIAIPSCSFAPYVRLWGQVTHCDCNLVPGILRFGEFHDVAGLIAPRPLLIVHGRRDPLHQPEHVAQAMEGLRRIYEAAGAADRVQLAYGDGGHRFYADLMWPFVAKGRKRPGCAS
ncbi:MAG: alpha/beta hydrolase [Planctomycetes bacterium]|nr:alpha/beta hydrolase [Planctomycetota bacterium]